VNRPKSSILGALTALQRREGWLPRPELEALALELSVPLHRLESLSTFYTHFRRTPPSGSEIAVCRDVACRLAGGAEAQAALAQALADDAVEIREVSCLGRCDTAPAACVGARVTRSRDVDAVRQALANATPSEREVRRWAADPYASESERYGALRAALEGDRQAIAQPLEIAGLRGMGGAGFPTHRKWCFVADEPAAPKTVVCNADESEPGTFKDREILHDLPHLVIEGMLLAARFVGASRGIVFIRHEYEAERLRLETALDEARARGVLGASVLGSDFDFEIDVFVSPGGYILGEETALLECLEDRRGEPRNKPPFPGRHGLHGQPTLINNVETFAHAAAIIARGAEWWQNLGRTGFAGHKFMAVSGDVAEPGVVRAGRSLESFPAGFAPRSGDRFRCGRAGGLHARLRRRHLRGAGARSGRGGSRRVALLPQRILRQVRALSRGHREGGRARRSQRCGRGRPDPAAGAARHPRADEYLRPRAGRAGSTALAARSRRCLVTPPWSCAVGVRRAWAARRRGCRGAAFPCWSTSFPCCTRWWTRSSW
jgi:NADH:ubiquinone oxidoreductase subunit E